MLFKYGDGITFKRKIVGAAQSCGARSDNCDFFIAVIVALFGHEANIGSKLLIGNELLDFVDCYRLVNLAAGALGLAGVGADTSADRGERIFLLNKVKSLGIFALSGKSDVALNRDMCGASGLAGRGTCLNDILAVDAVILVPLILCPFIVARSNFGINIGYDLALGAELLSELDGVHGAVFGALSAGNAVFLVNLRYIV